MNLNFTWNIQVVHLRFKFKWGSYIFVCWSWWSLPRVTLKLHPEMIPGAGSSGPPALGLGCHPSRSLPALTLRSHLESVPHGFFFVSPVPSEVLGSSSHIPRERCLSVSLVIWEIQVKTDLVRRYTVVTAWALWPDCVDCISACLYPSHCASASSSWSMSSST